MPKEKSAGAIIFRREPSSAKASEGQGKDTLFYLLLHYPGINRKGGHWEFAKGHIEEGEDYEKTVRREVLEETGLKDIKILPGFKEHIKYFFKTNEASAKKDSIKDSIIFKLVTFFVAETKTRDVRLSLEHDGFLWLPLQEAIKQVTYKNAKDLLKKSDSFIHGKNKVQSPSIQSSAEN